MISFFIRLLSKIISRQIDRIIANHPNRETVLSWIQRNNAEDICSYFDFALLESTYIVETENVPNIPIPKFFCWFFDSDAIEDWNEMEAQGITLKDTIFIHKDDCYDWVVFHELVHAVQWRSLGDIDFIFTYGILLFVFSYDDHPLEQIAYDRENWYEKRVMKKIEGCIDSHALEQRDSLRIMLTDEVL